MGATEFIEDMPSHVLKLILFYNTAVSGLPFSSPGDLPDPGIEPRSLALQADSLPSDHQESPGFKGFDSNN